MSTNIEEILLATYAAVEALSGHLDLLDPGIPFLRHRLREVALDTLPLPDRIRAVLCTLGSVTKSETWSSSSRRWYQGELRVQIGYVSPQESARDADLNALGYEGMADSDTPLVVNKVLYSAFAALSDVKSPEYLKSDPSIGTSRLHVFVIGWAETV